MAMRTGNGTDNNTFGVKSMLIFVIVLNWVALVSSSRHALVGVERFGVPNHGVGDGVLLSGAAMMSQMSSGVEVVPKRIVRARGVRVDRYELVMRKMVKEETMVMSDPSHGDGQGFVKNKPNEATKEIDLSLSKHSGPSPGVGH